MPRIAREISAWFEMPDDPFGGRVHVRLLKRAEVEAIMEKAREIKAVHVKEFRQTETSIRIHGAKTEITIAAVKDWENFFNEKDEALKCTPPNVRIMCLEDGFMDFVDRCLKALEDQEAKKREAELKN
jgi:hypothetical protein